MGILVLVRHGESRWNLSNRFTGWCDVPLSEEGIHEAERCAEHCKRYEYNAAFTSDLIRAQETLSIILSRQNSTSVFQHEEDKRYSTWIRDSNRYSGSDIPVFSSAVLNERYYGALQGMDKNAAEKKYGKDKVLLWRRSYRERPPRGESIQEAHIRMHSYLLKKIFARVKRGEKVILTSHGNTLRGVIKHLEGISDENITHIDLPEATPLVYDFRKGKFIRIAGEYHLDRPLR